MTPSQAGSAAGASPVFSNVVGTPLYVADPDGLAGQRCAFLATASAEAPAGLSATLTLAEALTQPGAFLFVPALPDASGDPAPLNRFIAAVLAFLAGPAQRLTRFLWLPDATAADPIGVGASTLAATTGPAVSLPWAGYLPLAPNMVLRVAGGTTIAVSADSSGLEFSGPGGPNTLVVTPRGPAVEIDLTSDVTVALLDAPATAGCLSFTLAPAEPDLAALGVGLRYFVTDLAAGQDAGDAPAFVQALPYPVFALGGSTLPLSVEIDPLAPLDPGRSALTFGTASDPVTAPLGSYFRSSLNAPVTLLPQAGAQLLFARDVRATTATGVPAATDPCYLTPAGEFALAIDDSGGQAGDFGTYLMAGVAAQEYFTLPSGATGILFTPGSPAFAAAGPAATGGGASYGPLTTQATTSWVYLTGQETYFAQPDAAVVHQPLSDPAQAGFLGYLPIPAGALPPPADRTADEQAAGFPMVPYAGVDAAAADYLGVEAQVLSATRRAVVYRLAGSASGAAPAVEGAPVAGTTPQGLLLEVDGSDWTMLTLAQTPADAGTDKPLQLQFGDVTGPLRAALQGGQVFLVASSCEKLLGCASIPTYLLTVQSFTDLEQSIDPVVPPAVLGLLKPLQGTRFGSLADYRTALQQALGADYPAYADLLVQVGAFADVSIASWHFDLSPYFWAGHQTMMIAKFTPAPLASLVADTTSWAMAAELNDDPLATQQALQAIVAQALDDTDPSLGYFRDTVLADPAWNGVLFLNARVPLSGLPAQIEGIAAGVNPDRFMAHHVGITVTPVQAGASLAPQNSTLFGLIRYSDPSDLADADADYQFKVQLLEVLFANSEVASFASTVELLANRFFGERVTLMVPSGGNLVPSPIGNNLKLQGVYQRHGDSGSYVFASRDTSYFQSASKVLDRVIVNAAEFVTIVPPSGVQVGDDVETRFTLGGTLAFRELAGFDAFSYGPGASGVGGLSYRGLSVDMSFPPDQPTSKTFAFDARQIGFDPSTSTARPASLYPHFPLTLSGLVQASSGQIPGSLNYMPVDSPLTGSQLGGDWYGLTFDLNLGSLGALAASGGFVASLLLGWQPDDTDYKVYVGLRIPGATGGKREISLEGVLKLSFGDLRIVVNPPSGYILQLRGISLSLLSISFPPGQTDLLLFGDPSGTDNSTLGWYAAYAKQEGGGTGGGDAGRVLQPLAASPLPLALAGPRRRRGDLR